MARAHLLLLRRTPPPIGARVSDPADPPPSNAVTSDHVAKGFGTTMLARMGGIIEVVAQPLYVAMFGLASFGLYAVLWSLVNLIENIADLGMTSAMQRTVPQAKDEQDAAAHFRAALIMGVLPSLFIAAIASIAAPSIAPMFNVAAKDQDMLVTAIRLFAWALPLWAFVEVTTSALRAQRVFGAEIRLRVFWEQVLRLLFAAGFWAAGWGIMGLLIAHLLSLGLTALIALRLVGRYFHYGSLFTGKVPGAVFRENLGAGLAMLPANMAQRLYSDGGPIILNWVIPGAGGAVAAGLFTIARKISSLIQTIRLGFAYVLSPLASAANKGADHEVSEIYGFATRVLTALALPAGCVLAAAGPAILAFFGSQAAVALPCVIILIGSRIIEAIAGAAQPIQQVISTYRSQMFASFAGIAVAALAGWWLVPAYTLTGMALAVTLGLAVGALLPVVQLEAQHGLHPFKSPFPRMLAIATLCSAIGAGLTWVTMALPHTAALPIALVIMIATIWASIRYALPLSDRQALGKTGRVLKLA